jgi:hypothetical protein
MESEMPTKSTKSTNEIPAAISDALASLASSRDALATAVTQRESLLTVGRTLNTARQVFDPNGHESLVLAGAIRDACDAEVWEHHIAPALALASLAVTSTATQHQGAGDLTPLLDALDASERPLRGALDAASLIPVPDEVRDAISDALTRSAEVRSSAASAAGRGRVAAPRSKGSRVEKPWADAPRSVRAVVTGPEGFASRQSMSRDDSVSSATKSAFGATLRALATEQDPAFDWHAAYSAAWAGQTVEIPTPRGTFSLVREG